MKFFHSFLTLFFCSAHFLPPFFCFFCTLFFCTSFFFAPFFLLIFCTAPPGLCPGGADRSFFCIAKKRVQKKQKISGPLLPFYPKGSWVGAKKKQSGRSGRKKRVQPHRFAFFCTAPPLCGWNCSAEQKNEQKKWTKSWRRSGGAVQKKEQKKRAKKKSKKRRGPKKCLWRLKRL